MRKNDQLARIHRIHLVADADPDYLTSNFIFFWMPMKPQTDTAWGIDRYKQSPTFGEVVEEVILLWNEPGAPVRDKNLGGAIKHGTEVQIVDETSYRGQKFYRVECVVEHEGREYPQAGWVSGKLLKEKGGGEDFGK